MSGDNLQRNVNSIGIRFIGGEDLDEYIEPGTWSCNSYEVAKTLKHTPPIDSFGSGFRFDVFATSVGGRVQRIMIHDTIPKIFYRSKFSETWNTWSKSVSNSDLKYTIPWTIVPYTAGSEEALNKIDNPQTLFPALAEHDIPFVILVVDKIGTSPYGGGTSCIFGYEYQNTRFGFQMRFKYDSSRISARNKRDGVWSDWTTIGS